MGHDGVGLVVRVPEGAEAGLTPFGFSREHATSLAVGTYALFEDEQAFIDIGPLTLLVRPVAEELTPIERSRPSFWPHRWVFTSFALHAAVLALVLLGAPPRTIAIDPLGGHRETQARLLGATERPFEASLGDRMHERGRTTSLEPRLDDSLPVARERPGERDDRRSDESGRAGRSAPRAGSPTDVAALMGTLRSAFGSSAFASSALGSLGAPLASPYDGQSLDSVSALGTALDLLGAGGMGMHGVGRGAGGRGEGQVPLGRVGTRGGSLGSAYGASPGWYRSRESETPQRIRVCGYVGPGRGCVVDRAGLSREVIRSVVARNRPQIRACYQQALTRRPGLEGRITVRWTVTPEGRVGATAVESNELGDTEVGACVSAAVARWAFPASDTPTSVTYPFVLTSS